MRFETSVSLTPIWRGGVARAVSVSAGIVGRFCRFPSLGDEKSASLADQVDRAGDDGILILRRGECGGEIGFQFCCRADGFRSGKQASARCSARRGYWHEENALE